MKYITAEGTQGIEIWSLTDSAYRRFRRDMKAAQSAGEYIELSRYAKLVTGKGETFTGLWEEIKEYRGRLERSRQHLAASLSSYRNR